MEFMYNNMNDLASLLPTRIEIDQPFHLPIAISLIAMFLISVLVFKISHHSDTKDGHGNVPKHHFASPCSYCHEFVEIYNTPYHCCDSMPEEILGQQLKSPRPKKITSIAYEEGEFQFLAESEKATFWIPPQEVNIDHLHTYIHIRHLDLRQEWKQTHGKYPMSLPDQTQLSEDESGCYMKTDEYGNVYLEYKYIDETGNWQCHREEHINLGFKKNFWTDYIVKHINKEYFYSQ